MPRLEIETIQDFKILHEIGALTPDMTVKLSRILLGEDPSAKKTNGKKNNSNDENKKTSTADSTPLVKNQPPETSKF